MPNVELSEVIAFVREYTGVSARRPIGPDIRLEADLDVTGDDGDELLRHAAERFQVDLASRTDGIARALGLGPNEYFFGPEGFDPLGFAELLRRLRGKPRPSYRDLTVGELHLAIQRAPSLSTDPARG